MVAECAGRPRTRANKSSQVKSGSPVGEVCGVVAQSALGEENSGVHADTPQRGPKLFRRISRPGELSFGPKSSLSVFAVLPLAPAEANLATCAPREPPATGRCRYGFPAPSAPQGCFVNLPTEAFDEAFISCGLLTKDERRGRRARHDPNHGSAPRDRQQVRRVGQADRAAVSGAAGAAAPHQGTRGSAAIAG